MEKIYILDGLRTPIGSKGRSLKDVAAVELGSCVVRKLLERNKNVKKFIGELILGNVVGAGLGQHPARQVAAKAGLDITIPAFAVNKVCGSGLKAVISAAQALRALDADVVLAGGIESASKSPYLFPRGKKTADLAPEDVVDALLHDGLLCGASGALMGEIAEETARRHKISRELQDAFALSSHQKASRAVREKIFESELVPVSCNGKVLLDHDEKPRAALTLEILSKLPAAFAAGGTVTAGNSSAPADGAAALLLASGKIIKEKKLKPRAVILGYVSVAVEPKDVFTASALALKECLKKCGLKVADIDIFEVNEAFAVQCILTERLLKLEREKLNPFGGAIALGHPLGVSGARGLVTLLNALRLRRGKTGIISVCLGGGEALALALRMTA